MNPRPRRRGTKESPARICHVRDLDPSSEIDEEKIIAIFHKIAERLKLNDCDIVRVPGFGDFSRFLSRPRVFLGGMRGSRKKIGEVVGGNLKIRFDPSRKMKKWLSDRSDIKRHRGLNPVLSSAKKRKEK